MATGITSEMFSEGYKKHKALKTLLDRFHKGDLDYLPTKQKEDLAMLAAQYGQDFRVESKPIKKGLFNLVDTALFGLVPNKWAPKSIGEDYFGESRADRIAGTLGTVAGFGTGVAGVTKLAGKAAVGLGNTGIQGSIGRGAAKVSDYGTRGIEATKRGSKSLWDMTSEQGNRLRSAILNKEFYKGASNTAGQTATGMFNRATNTRIGSSLINRSPNLGFNINPRTTNLVDDMFGY